MKLKAKVVEGKGVRSKSMRRRGLQKELKELLGVDFYPGSLNLYIDRRLETRNCQTTPLGRLCPARLNGRDVFIKSRKTTEGMVSAYADVCLRDVLDLESGDTVTLEIDDRYIVPHTRLRTPRIRSSFLGPLRKSKYEGRTGSECLPAKLMANR